MFYDISSKKKGGYFWRRLVIDWFTIKILIGFKNGPVKSALDRKGRVRKMRTLGIILTD
jgi:hypothetical protein